MTMWARSPSCCTGVKEVAAMFVLEALEVLAEIPLAEHPQINRRDHLEKQPDAGHGMPQAGGKNSRPPVDVAMIGGAALSEKIGIPIFSGNGLVQAKQEFLAALSADKHGHDRLCSLSKKRAEK